MRILNLTKFYFPYRGGMETVVKNITDANLATGIQSDVLCSNIKIKNEKSKIGKAMIYRMGRLLTLKSTSICPLMPWKLKFLANDYDLLHVHFPDPMSALSIFLMRPSTPFIIHWHSDIIKQKKLMLFFEPLQRWCLENASAIITTSEAYFKSSPSLQPYANKVKVIPIGIESENLPMHRELGEKKLILSVGRLTNYKGFQNLILAARLLPDNYEIKIVGDGELQNSLQCLIENNNLSHKVSLLGSKSSEELKDLFIKSDIFCLPSNQKSEAFGVVLIEAMSYSLPIVACDIAGSGVPWVNQNEVTGFNTEINDPEGLAQAIVKILEDKALYSKFSVQSYQRFEKEFRLTTMMSKIWNVYNHVLKRVPKI